MQASDASATDRSRTSSMAVSTSSWAAERRSTPLPCPENLARYTFVRSGSRSYDPGLKGPRHDGIQADLASGAPLLLEYRLLTVLAPSDDIRQIDRSLVHLAGGGFPRLRGRLHLPHQFRRRGSPLLHARGRSDDLDAVRGEPRVRFGPRLECRRAARR